jgi:hypothetical protein
VSNGGSGGALTFTTSGTNKVLIEESLFYKCTTSASYHGGAIYFENYGHCIFFHICSLECITGGSGTIYGQFCYCKTNSDHNYNLSIISSSLLKSINSNGGISFYFLYGTHNISKINSSNNNHKYHTGFELDYILYSSTKQSIFENNIAIEYNCIWWHSSSLTSSNLQYSNIINNSQLTSSRGILGNDNHIINMKECSIINNNPNNIAKLFHKYNTNSQFIIDDCVIDIVSFSTPGDYIVLNNLKYYYFLNTIDISNINFISNTMFNDCIYHQTSDYYFKIYYYQNNQYNPQYFHEQINFLFQKISCQCNNNYYFHYLSKQLFLHSLIILV